MLQRTILKGIIKAKIGFCLFIIISFFPFALISGICTWKWAEIARIIVSLWKEMYAHAHGGNHSQAHERGQL